MCTKFENEKFLQYFFNILDFCWKKNLKYVFSLQKAISKHLCEDQNHSDDPDQNQNKGMCYLDLFFFLQNSNN